MDIVNSIAENGNKKLMQSLNPQQPIFLKIITSVLNHKQYHYFFNFLLEK